MKIPQPPPGSKGSFGISDEVNEDFNRQKEAIERQENKPKVAETTAVVEEGLESFLDKQQTETAEDKEAKEDTKKLINGIDPVENLRRLGIDLKPEDFHNIMFRGYVEKTVLVAKNPMNGQELTAKIKTLTAEEYDAIDELVANEIDRVKMTNSGVDTRRTMCSLSFAVLELNNKPICSPVLGSDKKIDTIATAKKRKEVLLKLNPFIINKIVEIQGTMSASYTLMLTHPEYNVIKK